MRNIFSNLWNFLHLLRRIKTRFKTQKSKSFLWQSAFGWSVSAAWLMLMSSICWVAICGRKDAVEIIMAMVETAPLWGVALGVLGIAFMKGNSKLPLRSTQKKINNKQK